MNNGSPLTLILSPRTGRGEVEHAYELFHREQSMSNWNTAKFDRFGTRLSLWERERIKVRDSSGRVLPGRSKLPEGHYQALAAPDDSKNVRRRFLFWPEIPLVPGHGLRQGGSCGLSHPIRWQVSRPDNRNPEYKDGWDAAAGTYSKRSFYFEDGARECVRSPWRSCGGNERESLGRPLDNTNSCEETNGFALTLILSPRTGRGGVEHAGRMSYFMAYSR
jgi:hypothetical protein